MAFPTPPSPMTATGSMLSSYLPVRPQMSTAEAVRLVQRVLPRCDHLRKRPWRGARHPLEGHSYIAAEAVKYLSVDGDDLKPEYLKRWSARHGKFTHWYLRTRWGEVIDPTADQFPAPPHYDAGRGCGFLTKGPSRRARALIELVERERASYNSTVAVSFNPTQFVALTGLTT